jgi:hypothetical protein
MLTVENVIQNPRLFEIYDGDVHLHEGPSTAGLPEDRPPVNVVQTDQTVYAHFRWKQRGFLTRLFDRNCQWECRVYLERMGAGEVGDPSPQIVNFTQGEGVQNSAVIAINGLAEGAYKVIATLLFKGPRSAPTPLAAYDEIGVLQVYQDS